MNCGLLLVSFVLCLLCAVNGEIFKLKFEFGCKEGDDFVTITDVKFRNPKGQVEVYGVALVGNPEGSFQEIPISHWRMQPQEVLEAIENCKERLEEESKNNNKPLAITAMYVCDESDKLFQIAVQLRNLNDIELNSFYKIQQFLNQDVQANPAPPQQTIRERVSFVANQARRIARERREALEQMGPLGSLDEVNEHRAFFITEAQKVRTFIRENQLNSAENGLLTAVINELQEDIDRGIASLTEEANQIPMGGVHDAAQGFISNMSEFMRAAPPDTEEEARERVQKLFGIKEEGLKFEFGCKEGDDFVTITDVKFRNPKGKVEVHGVALEGNPEGIFQKIPILHWRMPPQEVFEAIENCKERLEEESKNNKKLLSITAMYVCDESDKLFEIAVQLKNRHDIELNSFSKIQQFLNQYVSKEEGCPIQ